ncbi:hypothetical protein PFLUV_G00020410 [Perca fluviatilis]|uniref:Secreted protein n=1 Tax=Perca fluviatilis TaxID=8168 RepID=A0A6A5FK98_PERFL|nr:hypothetical protein PFLUV_G00020410 [Perca fluviatilis]
MAFRLLMLGREFPAWCACVSVNARQDGKVVRSTLTAANYPCNVAPQFTFCTCMRDYDRIYNQYSHQR